MKKALKVMAMLLFVVSMTALTSCKKEKDKLIIGKWECVTATYTDEGVTQTIPYLTGMVWEFKANGTVVAEIPGDYSDVEEVEDNATYVVSGDALTIKSIDSDGDIDTETYIIKELTKSKLVLEERDEDELLVLDFKKI